MGAARYPCRLAGTQKLVPEVTKYEVDVALPAWCEITRHGYEPVASREPVESPEEAAKLFSRRLRPREVECMAVLLLDGNNRPMALAEVAQGSVNRVGVRPRELFRLAVVFGAAAILMAHNHPSSGLRISPQDRQVTTRMRESGELLGITLLDHVIISGKRHISLAEVEGWWKNDTPPTG